MSIEPKEPRYRPIPFALGYMVSRDGGVARVKPYRVLKVLPFHDVIQEARRSPLYRSVGTQPDWLDVGLIPFPPARWFTPDSERAWLRSGLHRTHVPLTGDVQCGWTRVDIPLGGDAMCCARLMMHGPSVSAFVFANA